MISETKINVCSYGGGVNSTAMLILLEQLKIPIELITFADTGGERPSTYTYVEEFSKWLVSKGYPSINTVKKGGLDETLYQKCWRHKMLPSPAYGRNNSCSIIFKQNPQDKARLAHPAIKQAWNNKEAITCFIGYDFGEKRRARISKTPKYTYKYPLIENQIARQGCIELIKQAGLPIPTKTACTFCPNTKPSEIYDLADNYPDLLKEAIELEENANLRKIKGLGRNFSWGDLMKQERFSFAHNDYSDMPCVCYDG